MICDVLKLYQTLNEYRKLITMYSGHKLWHTSSCRSLFSCIYLYFRIGQMILVFRSGRSISETVTWSWSALRQSQQFTGVLMKSTSKATSTDLRLSKAKGASEVPAELTWPKVKYPWRELSSHRTPKNILTRTFLIIQFGDGLVLQAVDRESIVSQCMDIHRNPRISKCISMKAWIIKDWYP